MRPIHIAEEEERCAGHSETAQAVEEEVVAGG